MFSSIVHALCDLFWHFLGYQAVCLCARFLKHCTYVELLGYARKEELYYVDFVLKHIDFYHYIGKSDLAKHIT